MKQGKTLKILEGPIWNMLPRYALPIAATGILSQLFNASDIAIVGNFSGERGTAAVAAVGANAPLISLIVNIFLGLALGTNVVIAKAIGQRNEETVRKAVHTSVIVAVIGGILIGIFGQCFAVPMLSLLHVPEEVLPLAILYFRIYLLGLPVILLYHFESAIFRSAGDTKGPLIALAASGVLNIILNLFFVTVCRMTVDGVAYATVISNAVSAILLLIRLLKSERMIRVEVKSLRFHWSVFRDIMRIGIPAGLQSGVFAAANILIQSAINSLGTVVMAASSASSNIELFAYYVMNSFSQACTTFVGQNYGAGNLKRCKRTLGLCLIEDAIASGISFAVVLFFGKALISIFDRDPQVIAFGYTRLKMILAAYTFSMLYEVMSGYLRGFGISLTPAILTMTGVCGVRFFWIYRVFPKNPTFQTIMTAYPISLATTALLILIALLVHHPAKRHLQKQEK